jgi:hypothetical protein
MSAEIALAYMTAGRSITTFKSNKTEKHFTFRLYEKKIKGLKKGDPKPDNLPIFVSAMTGPNNEGDYSYFGFIDPRSGKFTFSHKSSKLSKDELSVKAFMWAYERLTAGLLPADMAIYHNGRCGRCQRLLTVPHSIETGIGPECQRQMGI